MTIFIRNTLIHHLIYLLCNWICNFSIIIPFSTTSARFRVFVCLSMPKSLLLSSFIHVFFLSSSSLSYLVIKIIEMFCFIVITFVVSVCATFVFVLNFYGGRACVCVWVRVYLGKVVINVSLIFIGKNTSITI